MTKEQFYQQRNNKVKADFEVLNTFFTVRTSCEEAASLNKLSYSVVNLIIYPRSSKKKQPAKKTA